MEGALRFKPMLIHTDRCFYCGSQLTDENFTRDHFIPKDKGGSEKFNIVPCCKSCNSRKHARTLEEFRSLMIRHEYFERTGMKFSQEQIDHLASIGKPLDLKPYVFFFEKIQ